MQKSKVVFSAVFVLVLVLSAFATGFAQTGGRGNLSLSNEAITLESQESIYPAKDGKIAPTGVSKALPDGDKLVSVFVRLEGQPLATYQGGVKGLAPTAPQATGATSLDAKSPESQSYLAYLDAQQADFVSRLGAVAPSAQVTHNFTVVLNAVSMVVRASELDGVARMQGVTAILPDSLEQPQTDSSPEFIGAPTVWNALAGTGSDGGQGVVVGVLDTGIWPEHPSFADDGSFPAPPGGPYACDFGNTAWNPNDAPFTCNNKLIGAHEVMTTYKAVFGLDPVEFDSARDSNGHGTHTASTAAGNANVQSNVLGVDQGLISGISPRSHVIMYRVCGIGGCYSTDSAAAVQLAILDGVDAINFSISGGSNPYGDSVSLAFYDAYAAGVFVAASAGNSGPGADTTAHREPWTTTVAASEQSRSFLGEVHLTATSGETLHLDGVSVTGDVTAPLVSAADYGDTRCLNPFPAGTFTGQVVICQRGTNARVAKGYNVLQGGAGGMILYNPAIQGLASDNHWLPAVHLEYGEGQQLVAFFNSYKAVGISAALDGGVKVYGAGDKMAAFSSRGGKNQSLGISKPDVTSIGVQVLAGNTPMPESTNLGPPNNYFQAIAGTSMSSPHIAGSAALLKALHPDWSPGQIKSALMTTAKLSVVKEDGVTPADPFDYGSGREDLNLAGDPGMTVSETAQNLWDLAGQLWNANLPSVYVPVFTGAFTTERTFQSELPVNTCWFSSVDAPADVTVKFPPTFCLGPKGSVTEAKKFPIAVEGRNVPLGEVRFATLWLTDATNTHTFHMPITIVRREGPVTLDKSCTPTAVEFGASTDCMIEITNSSFDAASFYLQDRLPGPFNGTALSTDPDTGWAWWMRRNRIEAQGDLFGAQAPVPFMDVASWGNGYVPLSAFGVAPIGGVGDETIVNYNLGRPFLYGGTSYTRIGITSNGYAVLGGGTSADVQFINQNLPDAARPNNVLAPFWSDLNPGAGGALRLAYLSSGGYYWLVLDWEGVENYSDGLPNDFQIWLGSSGVEDISFAYGPNLTDGDLGYLTVGAENFMGNEGVNWYYNGAGTLPLPESDDLIVYTTPGAPGETKTIYFSMVNRWISDWQNCAVMNVNADPNNLITACVNGTVTFGGVSNSPMAPFAGGPTIWLPLIKK